MLFSRLKYFCTVAEELNITRSAGILHVTQQTLSNNLAQLEELYGTKFFERLRPQLVLTPEGRIFYKYAKQILGESENLDTELDEYRRSSCGTLSIGVTETRAVLALPHILSQFLERRGKVRVDMDVSTSMLMELEHKLLQGNLDIVINRDMMTMNSEILSIPLCREFFCLSIPRLYIERILADGESFQSFAALPEDDQKRRIRQLGLLNEMPYVYCGCWMARRAKEFIRQYTDGGVSEIDMTDEEILYTLPWYRKAAVFTMDLTALQVLRDYYGERDEFLLYRLECSESLERIMLYYNRSNTNWTIREAIPLIRGFFSDMEALR